MKSEGSETESKKSGALEAAGGDGDSRVIPDESFAEAEPEDMSAISSGKECLIKNLPLRIQAATGRYDGFFTECNEQRAFRNIAKTLIVKFGRREGMEPILGEFAVNNTFDVKIFVDSLQYLMEVRVERERFTEYSDDDIVRNSRIFRMVYGPCILAFTGRTVAVEQMSENELTRRNFVDFMNAIFGEYGGFRLMHDKVGIQSGEEIQKRSVAMSRVAEMLGFKDIIARSYLLKLKGEKDGQPVDIKGVFTEKIENGYTLHDNSKDNPLNDFTMDRCDPMVYRQASNLMLVDYICGYLDRFSDDMVFQFRKVNGVVRMIGIAGVNNYRCFGSVKNAVADTSGHMLTLGSIKVMSASAAAALQRLDVKNMRLQLNELCFSEAELDHMVNRIKMLTQSLKENKIFVVPDNQFHQALDIPYLRDIHNTKNREWLLMSGNVRNMDAGRVSVNTQMWPPKGPEQAIRPTDLDTFIENKTGKVASRNRKNSDIIKRGNIEIDMRPKDVVPRPQEPSLRKGHD